MSGCWVKVSHNGTLQRFLVSSDEINNITWKEFEQRLKESHHIDEPIIATHISKFGEYVQFDSDAELQELLHSVPHDSRSALRIFVKTFSQVDKAGVEDGDVGSSGDDKFASGINGANTSGSGGGWDGQHPQTDSFRSQLSFTTDAHTASSKSISTTMSGHLPSARVLGTDGWRVEVGGSSPAAGSGSGGQHSMSSFSSRSRLSQNSIVSQTGFSSFSSDVEALSKRVDNLALAGKDSLESNNPGLKTQVDEMLSKFREAFSDHPEVLEQINIVFEQVGQNTFNLEYAVLKIQEVLKLMQKYVREQQVLAEMGFTDTERNQQLLGLHSGDVERVVEALTSTEIESIDNK